MVAVPQLVSLVILRDLASLVLEEALEALWPPQPEELQQRPA